MTKKASAGIEKLATSIRIWWRIDGKRERETLYNTPPTPENCRQAQATADMIALQIDMGIFDRHQVFPNSPKRPQAYFGYYIEIWKSNEQDNVAPSSWQSYNSRIDHHIRPYWDKKQIAKVSPEQVEDWVKNQLKKKLSPKTIRDVLMLFRGIWSYWARHERHAIDPTQFIKLSKKDSEDIDPFTSDEIRIIIERESDPTLKNLWTVMLWSGLSSHELLPLAIEDLDLINGYLFVKRGYVKGIHRVTKNRRRKRQIELLPIVIAALQSQIDIIKDNPAQQISLLERDNITTTQHTLTWLWYSPTTGTHLTYDQIEKRWQKHMDKCEIPYRSPNNGRHTYASQVLSSGVVSAEWLANQLGHSSTEMIHRHYGKFIPKDSRHLITQLSDFLDSK